MQIGTVYWSNGKKREMYFNYKKKVIANIGIIIDLWTDDRTISSIILL